MHSFTYIKDKYGFIFYIEKRAIVDGISGFVLSACVYYPDDSSSRLQLYSGRHYGKYILHGLEHEEKYIQGAARKAALERVKSLRHYNPILGKVFLFMADEEVVEIYNPQESLNTILNDNHSYSELASFKKPIIKLLSLFQDANIPLSRVSLYGGLQCFMLNPASIVKDIDILIQGDEYYEIVKALVSKYPAPFGAIAAPASSNIFWKDAVRKRRIVSQMQVPGFKNVVCDVRILSNKDVDPLDSSKEVSNIEVKKAKVINADGSLSIPYNYIIRTDAKEEYRVTGTFYHFLGAATSGDRVSVSGLIHKGTNIIELTDPSTHYIHSF